MIEKANQRTLHHAEQILEESKGVRPLYPIIKALEVGPSSHGAGSRSFVFGCPKNRRF